MTKYPLKPAGMSDETWETLQRRLAQLQLKYANKRSEEKGA